MMSPGLLPPELSYADLQVMCGCYVVQKKAVVRRGPELSSPKVGYTMDPGEVWETSEARRSSEGLLRVHCSKGWVSTHSRQGDELLRKHKLVLQETVLSAVRTILLDSGWAVPDASLDVGSASLGRRVFVEGYGIGNVVEFKRAAIGTSSHLLRLDNGLMVEVKLQRNNRACSW